MNSEAEFARIRARFRHPEDRSAAVDQRSTGVPLELVLGRAQFAGVTIEVRRGVFVPRRRAESLIEVADGMARTFEESAPSSATRVALDLGCGTGAVAAAFAARHPDWQTHACDINDSAVQCAKANAARFGFTVHRTNWFRGLPPALEGRIDLVIAHLPYVPTADIPLLPRDYRAVEPRCTVDGGRDGLHPWRQVTATCYRWLTSGGCVLTQVTADQRRAAVAVARAASLPARTIECDDGVVVAACRPKN